MLIKIPIYAKVAAKNALLVRASLPKSKKFGTRVGLLRARKIIKDAYVSKSDAKRILRFYARFRNCRSLKCEGAIGLWGGRDFALYLNKKLRR